MQSKAAGSAIQSSSMARTARDSTEPNVSTKLSAHDLKPPGLGRPPSARDLHKQTLAGHKWALGTITPGGRKLSAENHAEPVVAQQAAGRLMGGMNAMGGALMLTDRRLVFMPLISKAGLKLSNKAAKASRKLHDWDSSR
jgi:hypothetical protein